MATGVQKGKAAEHVHVCAVHYAWEAWSLYCALRPCSGRSCEKHGLFLCFAALQLALQWKILMEDLARELNVWPDAVRLGHVRSRLTVRVLCNECKNG